MSFMSELAIGLVIFGFGVLYIMSEGVIAIIVMLHRPLAYRS